jgi:hypothetical protein
MTLSDEDDFYLTLYSDGSFARSKMCASIVELRNSFPCKSPVWFRLTSEVYMWCTSREDLAVNPAATALSKVALSKHSNAKLIIHGSVIVTGAPVPENVFKVAPLSLSNEARLCAFAKLAMDEIKFEELGIGRYGS